MDLRFPFAVELAVRGYEVDSWGHVNHAVFLSWLEHARWEIARVGGMEELFGASRPVVRRMEADWLQEVRFGDRVEVMVWPRRLGRTSFVLGCRIRIVAAADPARAGLDALRATQYFVCIEPGRGPVPVPAPWRSYFPPEDPGPDPPPAHAGP